MLIDRSNYELWLIDWIDGSLNNLQVEELLAFLDCNPDIQEEFEEFASVRLKPMETNFLRKDLLRKSPDGLSVSQLEHLSIAYLENDLGPAEKEEFQEIIGSNTEKARMHELIQKTKVKPLDLSHIHKSRLLKISMKQRVIQISVIGLSLAATLALIITSYLVVPKTQNNTGSDESLSVISMTNNSKIDEPPSIPAKTPSTIKIESRFVPATTPNIIKDESRSVPTIPLEKINFHPNLDLNIKLLPNTLIVSTARPIIPSSDDEQSNIGRFIARNFRQKFLKVKHSKDTPLKAYEIAEAGVTGLNKLLGWQMALNTVTNEKGEASSVYFTSKLLKFNTPVKNSEQMP